MTAEEELKLTIRKHRWALIELAYDVHMVQLNHAENKGVRGQFDYLLTHYGTREDVLAELLDQYRINHKSPAKAKAAAKPLTWIARHEPWAYSEACMATAEARLETIVDSTQHLYNCVKEAYGSGTLVLDALRRLLAGQKAPRKSLIFQQLHCGYE